MLPPGLTNSTTDMVARLYTPVVFSLLAASVSAKTSAAGSAAALITPSTYTVPGAFPTSAFTSYYNVPTQTASQVQPVIKDPVTVCTSQLLPAFVFSF
jgi:hypothetical protein